MEGSRGRAGKHVCNGLWCDCLFASSGSTRLIAATISALRNAVFESIPAFRSVAISEALSRSSDNDVPSLLSSLIAAFASTRSRQYSSILAGSVPARVVNFSAKPASTAECCYGGAIALALSLQVLYAGIRVCQFTLL